VLIWVFEVVLILGRAHPAGLLKSRTVH